jgi:hypothetical protein
MDINSELAIQAGVILGATTLLFKDVIMAFGKRLTQKIEQPSIELKKHQVFQKLSQHLQLIPYKHYADNPYKQAVLKDREQIFWGCVSATLYEMADAHYSKMSEEQFHDFVEQSIDSLSSYIQKLHDAGIPKKTIDCMEGAVIKTRVFVISLLNSIAKDEVFSSKEAKIWHFFTIYSEYLQYAHSNTIDVLIEANGSLYGESYKGIING